MNIKTAFLASAMLAGTVTFAVATPVTIDFSSIQSPSVASLTYSAGGYTVVATGKSTNNAGVINGDGKVNSTALHTGNVGGLGVLTKDDSNHAIDGAGVDINDLLLLTFNKAVKIVGISFALVDGQFGGDKAYFKIDGSALTNFSIVGFGFPNFKSVNWSGTQFGIGALGQNDEFKLRAIQVTPIPVPPAALLLATGVAGIGSLARRKRKQAS
jgi:hypothetical protein